MGDDCVTARLIRGAAAALVLGLGSGEAAAQMQAQPATAGAGSAVAAQDDATTVAFQGLQVEAQRVIADPSVKGFRAILRLRDTAEDNVRMAALSGPIPTLLDDMGNLYQMTSVSGGLNVCDGFRYNDAPTCFQQDKSAFVELPKGRDVNFVLTFAPVEGRVLEDLRALASTASLTARIVLVPFGESHRAAISADVVINNLHVPQ